MRIYGHGVESTLAVLIKNSDSVRLAEGNYEIGATIAVEIAAGQGVGRASEGIADGCAKSSGTGLGIYS